MLAAVLVLVGTTYSSAQKIVVTTGTVITNEDPEKTVTIPPGTGVLVFPSITANPVAPGVSFSAGLGLGDFAGFTDQLGFIELKTRNHGPPFIWPLGSWLQQGKAYQTIISGFDLNGRAIYKDPGNVAVPSGFQILVHANQGFLGFNAFPSMNRLGTAVFSATLAIPGGPSSIWKGDIGSSISMVALEGNPAPGTGVLNGNVFGPLFVPTINDVNRTAFLATLNIPGTPPTPAGTAVYKEASDGLTLVARTGGPAPGTSSAFNVISSAGRQGDIGFNNLGQVAFAATMANGGAGVWKEVGGPNAPYTLVPVALTGGTAPGTGGAGFATGIPTGAGGPFSGPLINGNGRTAFLATIGPIVGGIGGAATAEALFTEGLGVGAAGGPTGNLRVVAYAGMAAPGTLPGGTFAGGPFMFGPFSGGGAINQAGQVAFVGGWLSPTGGGTGIWITNFDGTIQPVVVSGQTINIPGQPQPFTITAITGGLPGFPGGSTFQTSGGQDGRSSILDEFGRVVYIAQLAPLGTTIPTLEAVIIGGIRPGISADASRNDVVDIFDFNAVGAAWGLAGTPGFIAADVNFDGIVNIFDWNYVSANWGQINAPGTGGFASVTLVPEPSSLALLALGLVGLIAAKRLRVGLVCDGAR